MAHFNLKQGILLACSTVILGACSHQAAPEAISQPQSSESVKETMPNEDTSTSEVETENQTYTFK
jgi:hypothetical protein